MGKLQLATAPFCTVLVAVAIAWASFSVSLLHFVLCCHVVDLFGVFVLCRILSGMRCAALSKRACDLACV